MTKEKILKMETNGKKIEHVQTLISIFKNGNLGDLIRVTVVGVIGHTETTEKETEVIINALKEYRETLVKEFEEA